MNRNIFHRCLLAMAALTIAVAADAQEFSELFRDSTLRIDYIFGGNASEQHIYLDKMSMTSRWHGKRSRMDEVPMEGNGQVIVRSASTGKVIYRNSFSTLFQEWLSYPEALNTSRSFENVFLIPMPKDSVSVSIELRNNRREKVAGMTHIVDPDDIMIRDFSGTATVPYSVVSSATDKDKGIDIAFVAEGYGKDEMDVFRSHVSEAVEALFAHEPFKSDKDRFNIVAVMAESEDSGTSEPSKKIWRQTALGSHFDTFYSERYLTTLNIKRLHDILTGIPYEHIIILVNTSSYGGGGILNSYNLSMTKHRLYSQVVVHEFGHSFAGLADEYAYEQEEIPMYPADVEPWEKNITTLVDFNSKWRDMMDDDAVVPSVLSKKAVDDNKTGVYEGAGYSLRGVYRPAPDCRMRSNEHDEFCRVCQRIIKEVIDFYTE